MRSEIKEKVKEEQHTPHHQSLIIQHLHSNIQLENLHLPVRRHLCPIFEQKKKH
jgi:hypothetical protein